MYYKEFEIDNFENLQAQVIPYVLKLCKGIDQFWNNIDTTMLLTNLPELNQAVYSIVGQYPIIAYLLAVGGTEEQLSNMLDDNSLHRDSGPQYRLNWPILNANSIETKFFTSAAEPTKTLAGPDAAYFRYHRKDCSLQDSYILTKPTLINVQQIHGLYRIKDKFPRIALSFKFPEEITI